MGLYLCCNNLMTGMEMIAEIRIAVTCVQHGEKGMGGRVRNS